MHDAAKSVHESYSEYRARIERQRRAKEEAVAVMQNAAYDSAGTLRHMEQSPLTSALSSEIAQMPNAPGKMFSRSDILAILCGRLATLKASAPDVPEAARFEIEYIIRIFENVEIP